MTQEPVKIEGLNEFIRNLKKVDRDLPKAVRMAFNEATDIVIDKAEPDIPQRTGRAAASLKSRSTQKKARVSGGSTRVPYYPWLDFGGRVGRNGSIERPFIREGRYIYKAYFKAKASGEFERAMSKALVKIVESAGIKVD